jgi:hypothetical protein
MIHNGHLFGKRFQNSLFLLDLKKHFKLASPYLKTNQKRMPWQTVKIQINNESKKDTNWIKIHLGSFMFFKKIDTPGDPWRIRKMSEGTPLLNFY